MRVGCIEPSEPTDIGWFAEEHGFEKIGEITIIGGRVAGHTLSPEPTLVPTLIARINTDQPHETLIWLICGRSAGGMACYAVAPVRCRGDVWSFDVYAARAPVHLEATEDGIVSLFVIEGAEILPARKEKKLSRVVEELVG